MTGMICKELYSLYLPIRAVATRMVGLVITGSPFTVITINISPPPLVKIFIAQHNWTTFLKPDNCPNGGYGPAYSRSSWNLILLC